MKKNLALLTIASFLGGHGQPNPFGPVVRKYEHEPEPNPEALAHLQKINQEQWLERQAELWHPLEEVIFNDESITAFFVDTRDFHVRLSKSDYDLDLHKTRKQPQHYFHTEEEVKALLNRYYTESGGPGDWRCLILKGIFRTSNWQFKYIRIFRTPQGLVVCNDERFVFHKGDLAAPIDQTLLHRH